MVLCIFEIQALMNVPSTSTTVLTTVQTPLIPTHVVAELDIRCLLMDVPVKVCLFSDVSCCTFNRENLSYYYH